MKKTANIVLVSVAAVAVAAAVIFVVIPLATSKQAEAKLSEALTKAGIPEDMWSFNDAYYLPILGHLVVENVKFGGKDGVPSLTAGKVTLALDQSREDLLAGSVDAKELKFLADGTGITAKSLSVNNFSVDKASIRLTPMRAIKKFGTMRLSDAVFRQKEQTYFSVGQLNADIGYTEGKIPLSSSVSLKDAVMDIRRFAKLPALRPEYRLSNFGIQDSFSNGIFTIRLTIDGVNLFLIKAVLGISLPRKILASGEMADFTRINYRRDVNLASFVFNYNDKSLMDHIFELAGMSGGRESAAKHMNETFMELAMLGGVDAKRFADEATQFIRNPGMFELKTNMASPMSFTDLSRNPMAMKVSLSINGGKPFTTGNQ